VVVIAQASVVATVRVAGKRGSVKVR